MANRVQAIIITHDHRMKTPQMAGAHQPVMQPSASHHQLVPSRRQCPIITITITITTCTNPIITISFHQSLNSHLHQKWTSRPHLSSAVFPISSGSTWGLSCTPRAQRCPLRPQQQSILPTRPIQYQIVSPTSTACKQTLRLRFAYNENTYPPRPAKTSAFPADSGALKCTQMIRTHWPPPCILDGSAARGLPTWMWKSCSVSMA